jgi:tRNA nucleotidyltransferase (CCA-adding enzyme)
VIKYGDFLSALENISRWEVEGLIIPDPIDLQRNVAAAVSPEKLSLLVRAAGAFLEYPSIKFFFPNPTPIMKESEISDAVGDKLIYLITMDKPEVDPEILHSQLRSFTNDLCKFLNKIGFNCLNYWYDVGDELAILFEVEAANLPAQKLRVGPPSKMKDASENFKKSCEESEIEPWLVGDRWQAYIPRKFTKLDEAVESWLSGLKGPKHVLDVASSFKLIKKNDLVSKYPKFSEKLRQFISISLLDLPPWEW